MTLSRAASKPRLMGLEDNRGAQEGIEWDPGVLAELARGVRRERAVHG